MKSIIVLLLLVLFFMSGMLFGVEREQADYSPPKVETLNVNESAQKEVEVVTVPVEGETISPDNSEYKQAPIHFTQKMASFIEGIVKGFYEIIVQILYQIVQLFY